MLATILQIGLYGAIAFLTAAAIYIFQFRRSRVKSKVVTYRVQGVPIEWDERMLQEALTSHFGAEFNLQTTSRPFVDASGESAVSTVTFKRPPPKLLALRKNGLLYIPSHSLSLDWNFLGLTVLHAPPEKDHEVDVVIVPGLGGHAFGSFKQKDGEYMWPRDALPRALVDDGRNVARVMSYGYDSSLLDRNSAQNIHDIATAFISNLERLLQKTDAEMKPIVFIGHSMGGLVIKQALILLSENKESSAARVFRASRGIAFFGVPHLGMKIDSITGFVGNGANAPLVYSLSGDNSQLLKEQGPKFDKIRQNIDCVYFYETERSPTAQASFFGSLTGKGPSQLLVPTSSATSSRPDDESIPIKRTHSDIVKFSGPQDEHWKTVAGALKRLVSKVRTTVNEELREEEIKEKSKQAIDECRMSLGLESAPINIRCQQFQEKRAAGTCEWLLKESNYEKWKDTQNEETSGILLIQGKPGSGKSVLMSTAVEDNAKSDCVTLSFFFDGRPATAIHERSEMSMYKSLLLELILRLSAQDLIDLTPAVLQQRSKDGAWSFTGVWQAMAVVLDHCKCQRLVIFIDALDECADLNARILPQFLGKMLEGRSVRLCLSARTLRPFSMFENRQDTLTIDVGSHNKHDIDNFLVTNLDYIQTVRPLIFEQMVFILSKRASNVFLWAFLVVEYIAQQEIGSSHSDQELLAYIDHIPAELVNLYRHLLLQVKVTDHEPACNLMLMIQAGKRPLSPDEMRSMLECSKGKPGALKTVNIESRIQILSSGLAGCHQVSRNQKQQTNLVQFMHKSVGDFLIQDAGLGSLDNRFAVGDAQAELHLAAFRLCFLVLSYKIDSNLEDDEIPFLSYAALFWMMHAREGEVNIGEDWSYPDMLDDCESYGAAKLIQLFNQFNHHRHYRTFADKDVPTTGMLYSETSILVFLAFAGCTKLVTRHLAKCPQCQSPSPKRAQNLGQAFYLASHRGYRATAEAILDSPMAADIDIDAAPDDITALFTACLFGHVDTVDLLMHRGADPHKWLDQEFEYALHVAASHEEAHVVDAMLRHCRHDRAMIEALFSAQTEAGHTVFHFTVLEGRSRVLEVLLHEAAKIKDNVLTNALYQTDEEGDTAYDTAVIYKKHLDATGKIDISADAKSLVHAIARFESLM